MTESTSARTRLLAYCGDEEAREEIYEAGESGVEPWPEVDAEPVGNWARGLPGLVRAATEGDCDYSSGSLGKCDKGRVRFARRGQCPSCHGSGRGQPPVPGLFKIALRVAREAYWVWVRDHWEGGDPCEVCANNDRDHAEVHCPTISPARRSLEAAMAWVGDPTEENLQAWKGVFAQTGLVSPEALDPEHGVTYCVLTMVMAGFPAWATKGYAIDEVKSWPRRKA